ncbi:hypothetical protein [Chitinophaga sp. ARDCPP14]|uniref:hypothetical protein n=1 Tax=Chitinophaga sp. ARDCPP14 TaxID=3391139 RepID=UPI003F51C395
MLAENYIGYKGLPELVGLHEMKDAITKGLTVTESVARLKRYHWTARRLSLIFTSRIAAMPIYELKMAFSLHAHYLAEHVEPFFNRVREMRQPPYGMDTTPHETLDILLDEVQYAPTTEALVWGIYGVIIPSLVRGLERHIAENNRLFDHPTFRICRQALADIKDIDAYGQKAVSALIDENAREAYGEWINLLTDCLATIGDLDGTQTCIEKPVKKMYSLQPAEISLVPRRDERFKDVYNMRVNAESFLLDPQFPPLPKTIMLYFKRMREIDVPEMMSSIVYETKDKPWNYYKDMIRQIWDEARHAMMGEVGFTSLDIDWKTIPFNITWSYLLNTKMTSKERHSILYFIEQGLMPAKTGKKYEWDVAIATANRLTELIQDYDWADEVLHAKIGRDWIVPELGGQNEAMEYGNKAWSKALMDAYDKFLEAGLTAHENWWPDIYKKACQHWGIEPDSTVLAYDMNYRDIRADRQEVAAD